MEPKFTFDPIAAEYDRSRPDYPEQLVADVLDFCPQACDGDLLEIGCGTGQATKDFVRFGGQSRITCVELGEQLAQATARKFSAEPRVRVIHSAFEEWPGEPGRYDLAFSGTAFHFIEPTFGYRKVHHLLRPGGATAFFWTAHVASDEPIHEEIRDVYRKYAPHLDDSLVPSLESLIAERSRLTTADGWFEAPTVRTYRWTRTYTTEQHLSLLNTHSRHRLLPDATRARLFREIGGILDNAGGTIVKPQAVLLFLARKTDGERG